VLGFLGFVVRFCSTVQDYREFGRRGGFPGRWESYFLVGEPMTLVLDGDHGHEDGVVVGKLNVVVFGRRSDFAKGGPLPSWAMAAMSADVVPFLKAL
jgi:hypothetical protein